ncbi:MAG: hypothetical protein AB8B66_03915 [Rickettsiaceae bacterium]
MNKIYYLLSRAISLLLLLFCPIAHCYAEEINKPVASYLIDNKIFRIIINGGYYSLGAIAILALLSINKKFREVLLILLVALLGLCLVIFMYEAYQNFEWLPSALQ